MRNYFKNKKDKLKISNLLKLEKFTNEKNQFWKHYPKTKEENICIRVTLSNQKKINLESLEKTTLMEQEQRVIGDIIITQNISKKL